MKASLFRSPRARASYSLPLMVISLTLLIFGVTIWLVSERLRQKIQEQIAGRDGEILYEIARIQESVDSADRDFGDSADQVTFLLKISRLPRLRDAMAIRLFDANGRFVDSFPAYVRETDLKSEDLETLKKSQPVSHFHAKAHLADQFLPIPEMSPKEKGTVSLQEILLPISGKDGGDLLGFAQYLLDGRSIAAQFNALDRNLLIQASVAFFVGGLMIAIALGWAFYRLQHSHWLLAERTSDLLRANNELTMAAKSSALGAVTAHLVHELKSPLFGLECFMTMQRAAGSKESKSEWETAISSTRRMQNLISEVVRVLRDENGGTSYELSLDEMCAVLSSKILPLAKKAGVEFRMRLNAMGTLSNRDANLVILVIDILIQNAIQSTSRGKAVTLCVSKLEEGVACEVHDEGPGFPVQLRDSIFTPCQSGKNGGNGIGLAIAKQLASHIGAELELKSSRPSGCIFALTLPDTVFNRSTCLAAEALVC